MLVRIASDLHLEFHRPWDIFAKLGGSNVFVPPDDRDKDAVLILAGDIVLISKLETYKDFFADVCERFKDVVYVTGNHEYYKSEAFNDSHKTLRDFEAGFENFHWLQNQHRVFNDTVIFGTTLWTDMEGHSAMCMMTAADCMPEFRGLVQDGDKNFTPNQSTQFFAEAKYFLHEFFKEYDESWKRIVVTHHAPSFESTAPRFKGSMLNGAFASELHEDIRDWQPNLWVHGHMHDYTEYMVGETRIVCNPKGYPNHPPEGDNFNAKLFIEV